MISALATAGSFLFKIGQGIAGAVKKRRSEKANAKKMESVLGLIEGENKRWDEYIKGINEVYSQLGDKTRRDIQKVFSDQTKQLKNAIQQRRIPEYLAGVEKLSKAQSEAISDAMLGIESARLGAEGQALKTSFAQKSQLAGLVPALQQVYGSQEQGGFGQTLQSAFSPITDWVTKKGNATVTDWLEDLNKKEFGSGQSAVDSMTDAFGVSGDFTTTNPVG